MSYWKILIVGLILALVLSSCNEDSVSPNDPIRIKTSSMALFYTKADFANKAAHVYRLNTDSKEQSKVVDGAIFSAPQGDKMAYSNEDRILFLTDLNGAKIQNISAGKKGFIPTLSPDGTMVLYTELNGTSLDNSQRIKIINLADNTERVLVAEAAYEGIPVFSPDSKKIAFMTKGDYVPGVREDNLYTINVDGTQPTLISSFVKHHHDGYTCLDWSPDGRKIACKRRIDDAVEAIVVFDIVAQTEQQIWQGESAWMPAFST